MTDAQKQALQYLATACGDYAATLSPSVKGPFLRECQEALRILNAEVPPAGALPAPSPT